MKPTTKRLIASFALRRNVLDPTKRQGVAQHMRLDRANGLIRFVRDSEYYSYNHRLTSQPQELPK